MTTKTVLTVATALALGGLARAAIIDFEADGYGFHSNGFSPVGHPTVKLTDTSGTILGLQIANFGSQGMGQQSLAVHTDGDGSKLRIDFTVPVKSLSLWFGNDDPAFAISSDRAWLQIWSGGSPVATVSMAMNLDDIMNQSIGYNSMTAFNRADFWYGDANGAPFTGGGQLGPGMIEIVDMIEYTPVPEPASALATAGLLGLAAVGLRRWRQRA
jgi:hypothetical protein